MTRTEVAEALVELSKYLEMKGENRFKVGAYAKAADAIETAGEDLDLLVGSGRLTEIEGIGAGTASVIRELVTEGRSSYLDELRKEFPPSLLELADIPGVGARKAMQLHAELGVETVDDLQRAVREGGLVAISGFGPKTIERVERGIATWKKGRTRVLLPMALEAASTLIERLESLRQVSRVEPAGELRRRAETVGRLDLVAACKDRQAAAAAILAADLPGRFQNEKDDVITGTMRPSLETRIVLATKNEFIPRLLIETGSEGFVSRLREIGSERSIEILPDGMKVGRRIRRPRDEDSIFELLGVPTIAPEMRETAAVLDLAIDPATIVTLGDIRGTFHVHTTWSDGKASLEEMVRAAGEMGFEYVGISDHSKTAGYAGGLTEERVRQQHAEIRKVQRASRLKIFRGTECDILADGQMDYDDATLASFDFVIASVHSRFGMPADEMSDRIIRAISNPWVTFLGHLTGRKLLIREGYSVEYDWVFDAAAKHGVAIEINGNPRRQDLDWRQMRNAIDRGVRFSINPDAHSVAALEHVTTGVWNARRGLVPRDAVLNVSSVDQVTEYLAKRRKRAKKISKSA